MLEEPDKKAIQRDLAKFDQNVASRLLRVELRRVGRREDALEEADRLLEGVLLLWTRMSLLLPRPFFQPPSVPSTLSTSPQQYVSTKPVNWTH